MPRKKKSLQQPKPKLLKENGNSISFSDVPAGATGEAVAAIFTATDEKLRAAEAEASGELQGVPGVDSAPGAAPAPPDAPAFDSQAFLLTGAHQVVGQMLLVSKVVGKWRSPAIAGPDGTWLLSEEEWKTAVASYGVQVVQKRWPSLASSITPEFALLALVVPWVVSNLAEPIEAAVRRFIAKRRGAGHGNTRENGDRENASAAQAA